ncbi:UrvD/REP family ATP-dependent DNA helicase [Subtercola frigoramans]|uniref:DNA 3'-5' helicase n=1 Tax=Subtercola frigoramans TaxID=120298 RepID=A0ABS2L426_9MICO|nr:UrvD/REP family ATP-dependent DNA helicase [Subtercola frigoramans]MBM7471769.1 superfamily I DNA/RNA helicase/RecB family exonuclease [Subtercola frigoramans]
MDHEPEPEADADTLPGPEAKRTGLDASQRSVLEVPVGDTVAVIGAPGSGKTTVLVELVADRVKRFGFAPSEIVVLTPTRQAATRLRDILALRLASPTNGPLARTVNSLAFQIVQAQAARTGAAAPALLTGAEHDRIIAELIQGHLETDTGPEWPDPLRPEVRVLRGFRTELRELMMRATENGVSPVQLADLGRRHGVAEWVAAGEFAAEYQQVVSSFRDSYLDSAELIAEARLVVARGEAEVLRGVRLVVVDDFPELSSGAVNFLSTLARSGVAIVAFGDPDMASASFRGGSTDSLGRLASVLAVATAPTIYLQGVYRHGPGIRSLIQRATARIGAAAAGRQRAALSLGGRDDPHVDQGRGESQGAGVTAAPAGIDNSVVRIEATSSAAEVAQIAQLLREHHLLRGVPWREMAVVVRSGGAISSFARGLALAEVPTATTTGGRALRDDYSARHLVTVISVATGVQELDDETITELLLGPFGGLDAVSLRRLRLSLRHEELAGGGNRSAELLLREALEAPGRLVTIDSSPARRVARLADSLAVVRSMHASGASIEELFWSAWSRSALPELWLAQSRGSGILADEANRNLDGIVGLFTAAKRFVERSPHRPATEFLIDVRESEVPEDSLSPRSAGDSVLVSTPTGVVGVQVKVVVIAGLQEAVWPNLRLRGSLLHPDRLSAVVAGLPPATQHAPDQHISGQVAAAIDDRAEVMGDELRMFVLAASRATMQTVLSCVANDDEQPSPFLRLAPEAPVIGRGGTNGSPVATHPLTLRALTGTLRRELAVTGAPEAATALARLAAEDVPGAHPTSWYGLLDPSTMEPLADLDNPEVFVDVSPSKLETFEKSPLAWYIDKVSGSTFGMAASIGTIVHSVMEEVATMPQPDLSVTALWSLLEQRWNELDFESLWLAERERRRTFRRVEGLSEYLKEFERSGGELVGGEAGFSVEVGRARLRGTIDRLERGPDGVVSVVDLKTGGSAPSALGVAEHAQLGSYQLALLAGAVTPASNETRAESPAESPAESRAESRAESKTESRSGPVVIDPSQNGGAVLLYVALSAGAGSKKVLYKLLTQPPLDSDSEQFFRGRIERAALGMAGTVFPGRDGLGDRDPHGSWRYRIHLVKAVSS